MPNFESFSRHMVPTKSEPFVTVHKRGTVSLNRSAFELLQSPSAVELLYDRTAQIVGLRPMLATDANASLVRAASPSPSGPWIVSAMAFTHFYEIDTSVSRRWPAYLEDDVLCIDISVVGERVTSNRARRPDVC